MPDLSLEDTIELRRRGLSQTRGTRSGYDPYDAVPDPDAAARRAADGSERRKRTDLRKLSDWIRLQRRVEALRQDDPDRNGEPPARQPARPRRR